MDGAEKVERRLDRAAEQDNSKSERRVTVWVAIIALVGVLLSAGGALLGAKWGATASLEADRQERIHGLCLELNTQLEKTSRDVFSEDSKFSKKKDPSLEHSARWMAFNHRAAVFAPVPVYEATEGVSSTVSVVAEWTIDPSTGGWGWRRFFKPASRNAKAVAERLTPDFDKAAGDLRDACRVAQGEDPLPTPSDNGTAVRRR